MVVTPSRLLAGWLELSEPTLSFGTDTFLSSVRNLANIADPITYCKATTELGQ